jgi:transcriptional regulator with GAF, ATPase, and Fis domain
LFGHEKGVFTGIIEVHQGYFERAESGTLFLYELDSLSAANQTRLLRVIQEGELEKVGGKQTLPNELRIISATNQNLENLVKQGLLRKQLHSVFLLGQTWRFAIFPLKTLKNSPIKF